MRRRVLVHGSWIGAAFLLIAVVRLLVGNGLLWHLGGGW